MALLALSSSCEVAVDDIDVEILMPSLSSSSWSDDADADVAIAAAALTDPPPVEPVALVPLLPPLLEACLKFSSPAYFPPVDENSDLKCGLHNSLVPDVAKFLIDNFLLHTSHLAHAP